MIERIRQKVKKDFRNRMFNHFRRNCFLIDFNQDCDESVFNLEGFFSVGEATG